MAQECNPSWTETLIFVQQWLSKGAAVVHDTARILCTTRDTYLQKGTATQRCFGGRGDTESRMVVNHQQFFCSTRLCSQQNLQMYQKYQETVGSFAAIISTRRQCTQEPDPKSAAVQISGQHDAVMRLITHRRSPRGGWCSTTTDVEMHITRGMHCGCVTAVGCIVAELSKRDTVQIM
jgi:hypothetical protein